MKGKINLYVTRLFDTFISVELLTRYHSELIPVLTLIIYQYTANEILSNTLKIHSP